MAVFHIDLQDGFKNDTVSILVGGREVARRENVCTRRMLGLAEAISISLPDETRQVTISIPTKGINQEVPLPATPTYLGASVNQDRVETFFSEKPFNYA